jgi:hypothetical protein
MEATLPIIGSFASQQRDIIYPTILPDIETWYPIPEAAGISAFYGFAAIEIDIRMQPTIDISSSSPDVEAISTRIVSSTTDELISIGDKTTADPRSKAGYLDV